MKDWRIGYYTDLCISTMNSRKLKKYDTNLVDINWLKTKIKKAKNQNKELTHLDLLKIVLNNIKQGEYD